MAKKAKKSPVSVGLVGGYVRKSKIDWPAGCDTLEDRKAHVDQLRRIRQAEIEADAARDGQTIDIWYDDMNISGRGEFIAKRLDFARLCNDAREGKLRLLYTRDLSRLFRHVKGQEFWFDEMEECGCEVRAGDLPQAADRSSTRFVRQILGSAAEYSAERAGISMASVLSASVEKGVWVGHTSSIWGLRYLKMPEGRFEFDPDTAPLAVRLFEHFIEHHGNAQATTCYLNRLLRQGDAFALPTPGGALYWNAKRVREMIRSALYQRRIEFSGLSIDSPEKIPQVIPPDLVAEALRLDEQRRQGPRGAGRRIDYTYTGLLTCGHCGGHVRAQRSYAKSGAYYTCNASKRSRSLCPDSFGACAARVDITIGRAILGALSSLVDNHVEPPRTSKRSRSPKPCPGSAEAMLLALDDTRQRILTVFKKRLQDWETTERELQEVERQRAQILKAQQVIEPAPAMLPVLTLAQRKLLHDRAMDLWAASTPSDLDKAHFLRNLKVTATMTTAHRPRRRTSPSNVKPDARDIVGGLLTFVVEIPTLGLTGEQAITIEEDQGTYERHSRVSNARRRAGIQ
jgi:DNA invertase Pin-like site-specific DNA recombinase